LTKDVVTISSGVRSLARKELKIRPEGGEKVNRPLAGKQKRAFPKRKCVEKLIFWELS